MRYKLLGNSGLRVSELCLGAWTFGAPAKIGPPKEECERVFRAYAEQGGNFLDVANKYSEGESEKWLGEFIGAERERFVLGTKFTLSMRHGDLNACGNHRKNIVQSVEASLRRLKTDYIDLYWLHQWDFTTPVDEIMRALDDLVRAGKVLYVGISDAPAWIVAQANTLAALRGWTPFVALQIEYSLIQRTVERELLPMARAFGLAVTPWGVIGGGVLGGRYDTAADPMAVADSRRAARNATRITERNLQIARKAHEIAQAIGHSPAQVALNWVLRQPGQFIPILGVRTESQLRENLRCLAFTLGDDHLRQLDEASRIDLGFPLDYLVNPPPEILDVRWGGTQGLLDNHHPGVPLPRK